MRRWLIIGILAFMASCSEPVAEEQVPADLIPVDSFRVMMVDVQLLEATFNQKFFREDEPNIKKAEFYDQIFKKHKVTKEVFELSYDYYSDRPEQMMEIYEYVINELSQREEQVSSNITDAQKSDTSPQQSAE